MITYAHSWHGWVQSWERDIPREVQEETLADPHGKMVVHAERMGWYSPTTGVFIALPRVLGDVVRLGDTMRAITMFRLQKKQIKRMAGRWAR